jgi:hypothetical protein
VGLLAAASVQLMGIVHWFECGTLARQMPGNLLSCMVTWEWAAAVPHGVCILWASDAVLQVMLCFK